MAEITEIERLSVGERREQWKQEDGFLIEYGGEHGFTLYVFLSEPTPEEKAAVIEAAEPPEIGFAVRERKIGLFTFRFGGVSGEATYYPGFYRDRKAFMDTGNALSFLILLIDGKSGELQGIRLVGAGRQFSREVALWCNDVCGGRDGLPVTRKAYNRIAEALQNEEIEKHHREAKAKWNYKDEKDEEKAAQEAAQEKGD